VRTSCKITSCKPWCSFKSPTRNQSCPSARPEPSDAALLQAHQQATPPDPVQAEGLSKQQVTKAAKAATKAANQATAAQTEYDAKRLKAEKAVEDLELFGKTSADLACALMDCSKVSSELHTALVTEAKILDYIEASPFTPAQAAKWMQFLAAVVAPYSSEANAVGRMMWCQAAAKICHEVRAPRMPPSCSPGSTLSTVASSDLLRSHSCVWTRMHWMQCMQHTHHHMWTGCCIAQL
jgi:hypothetical protein